MLAMEQRWAVAVLEGFAPVGGPGLAPQEGEVDYLTTMRKMMHASTGLAAFGLRLGLWLATFAPVFVLGKLKTMASLSRERRAELLEKLLSHRLYLIRELTLLLKLAACMAMFARPALRERSGYDRHQGLDYETVADSGERLKVRLDVVADPSQKQGVA